MKNSSNSSGVSALGLLGVAFVVLKLTNVIDWSWWYVTMPFWGGLVLGILILFVWYVIELIKMTSKNKKINKRQRTRRESKFQQRLNEIARERNLN